MMRDLAAEGQVALGTEGRPDIVLDCDRRIFRQIVLNLVSNAIKFTPPGGRVTIAWTAENDDFVLQVRDTGIGIPADQIAAVVQPFVQLNTGLDRRYQGVGLGLSIVKAFAEAHGGALAIESTPGEGTAVSVRFPRCVPAESRLEADQGTGGPAPEAAAGQATGAAPA
jgi:signal transduction histidine kinase